jgi:hypothetical protein
MKREGWGLKDEYFAVVIPAQAGILNERARLKDEGLKLRPEN